jgi:hypothetical protein
MPAALSVAIQQQTPELLHSDLKNLAWKRLQGSPNAGGDQDNNPARRPDT